jgi:hypothetical protein
MASSLGFRTFLPLIAGISFLAGCGSHLEPIRSADVRAPGVSTTPESEKSVLTAGYVLDASADESVAPALTQQVQANAQFIQQEESKRPEQVEAALPQTSITKPQLSEENKILAQYKHIDPKHIVAPELLKRALLFFHRNRIWFLNKKYITIVDYSLPSSEKRMFVVHMDTGLVESIYVAHGKGSDEKNEGVASKFSNEENSHASSLGAFVTVDEYKGSHGQSLRLIGLQSTNWRALFRKIVIHGADYVKNAPVKQGRSYGCFVVNKAQTKIVITSLKTGSLLYAGLSKAK